jgi:hypothetical protein
MAAEPALTVKKLVALTPEMAGRISAYRFDRRIDTESEAIRRLIDAGLDGGAKPRPLRSLLVDYCKAAVAADPSVQLAAETPEEAADLALRDLGTLLHRWAADNGLDYDRNGAAAPVFAAITALVDVPTDQEMERRAAEKKDARARARAAKSTD